MKIGIDYTPAINQNAGIARYVSNLVENLLKIDNNNQYIRYNFFEKYPPQPLKTFFFLLSYLNLSPDFLTKEVDIIHSTDFVLPASKKKKSVITIHDLIFLKFSQLYTSKNLLYMKRMAAFSANRADKIIADSESTKQDIIELLQIKEEKIKVVYPGIEERFKPANKQEIALTSKKYNLPQNYILNIGTIEPRKNLNNLIDAYLNLDKEITDKYRLVIIGNKGWKYEDIFSKLKTAKGIFVIENVEDKDLPAIYSQASVFVYPSLYEGFGLPIIEAMACTAPVTCSNTSSMPEAAGNAAILFDPDNVKEIAASIKKILSDEKLSAKLKKAGLAQAKKFNWQKTAQQTLDVYNEV